jgi:hypothetical protein
MDVALNKDCGYIWIKTDCEKHRRQLQGVLTQDARSFGHSESVQVNNAVIHVGVMLA